MKFKFDPNSTINEGRHRLISPKRCLKGTHFRRKSSTPGVSYLMCRVKKKKDYMHQSIRFNKKIWTEKRAGSWLQKNKIRIQREDSHA